jgi:hypothetical protein
LASAASNAFAEDERSFMGSLMLSVVVPLPLPVLV